MSENTSVRDRKSMRPIDIKDLWRIFLECFWIMAIAAVAVMVVMFIFVKITYKPEGDVLTIDEKTTKHHTA